VWSPNAQLTYTHNHTPYGREVRESSLHCCPSPPRKRNSRTTSDGLVEFADPPNPHASALGVRRPEHAHSLHLRPLKFRVTNINIQHRPWSSTLTLTTLATTPTTHRLHSPPAGDHNNNSGRSWTWPSLPSSLQDLAGTNHQRLTTQTLPRLAVVCRCCLPCRISLSTNDKDQSLIFVMARHKHPSHETKGRPRKIKTLTPAATPKKPFAPPPHTPRSRVTRKNTVEDPVERRILPSRAARNKVSAEDIEEIQVEAVKKLTIRIGKKPAATLTDESASEDSAISASEDSAISASEDSVISAAEVHDSSPTPVKRSKGAPRIQEEKPIACPEPICWKRFSSKAGLKSHLEKFDHTPEGIAFYKSERPFKCPITACPEIYKCFDSLYKHGVGAHSGMSDEAKLEAFGSTIAKKLAKFRAESAIAMPSDDDDSTLPQQHTVAGGSAESSPLSDVDTLPYDVSNLPSVSIPSANRESARKGKGPARNITAHHEVIPISTVCLTTLKPTITRSS